MPRTVKPLTETKCKSAKPKTKPYKLFDGDGLFLLVTPTGGKLWRFKYRLDGKERGPIAFGSYPEIGLAAARDLRRNARELVAKGIDPDNHRKEVKLAAQTHRENTFAALAEAWYQANASGNWRPTTAKKVRLYLDLDLLPPLGTRPIAEIKRAELITVLRKIEARGAFNVAKKCRGWLSLIFRYARSLGVIEINQATDLNVVAAQAPKSKPYAHVPQSELPAFLRALNDHKASLQIKRACLLLLLTGFRPGELRKATWDEIDFKAATWNKSGADMKMKRAHVVPLSAQAITILSEMRNDAGRNFLVFASPYKPKQPISDGTINRLLGAIGYKGRQTGHGFRHVVSTALNERGYNKDWIERQLAHGDDDEIRGTYNQAQYLDQRREMMQEWADHLDSIKANEEITPYKSGQRK
ncbi:tyrosine-type recombinase/integrase [Stenotrophobium rhamnosiphilum]|uniref:Integrase n=1 Tax=Stenotrophobium rhamnosiphilum TaxID=2029166 RepID=A0A2T5MIL2_9GAMM|nr:integrase arm-type DNA-binding domain-containing protein [Stenotrophobium rhamnosiphilum]PTU32400.1 integrase [Stenotrophobium rhamnosiphilum]